MNATPKHQISRPGGFTLIELLTVMAIIGILAGILIPTVGAIRKTARAAACVSNLHQIGIAMSLYSGENNDTLPAPGKDGVEWPNYWMKLIEPYARSVATNQGNSSNWYINYDGIFRCPAKDDFNATLNGGSLGQDYYRVSYAMQSLGDNARKSASRSAIASAPSQTVLVMDIIRTHFIGDNRDLASYKAGRHKTKDNILFLDGHVELRSSDNIIRDNATGYYVKK